MDLKHSNVQTLQNKNNNKTILAVTVAMMTINMMTLILMKLVVPKMKAKKSIRIN